MATGQFKYSISKSIIWKITHNPLLPSLFQSSFDSFKLFLLKVRTRCNDYILSMNRVEVKRVPAMNQNVVDSLQIHRRLPTWVENKCGLNGSKIITIMM